MPSVRTSEQTHSVIPRTSKAPKTGRSANSTAGERTGQSASSSIANKAFRFRVPHCLPRIPSTTAEVLHVAPQFRRIAPNSPVSCGRGPICSVRPGDNGLSPNAEDLFHSLPSLLIKMKASGKSPVPLHPLLVCASWTSSTGSSRAQFPPFFVRMRLNSPFWMTCGQSPWPDADAKVPEKWSIWPLASCSDTPVL